MDHLPLPQNPVLDPIIIPYWCDKPYDRGPVSTYPQREGWQVLYSPDSIGYLFDGRSPTRNELEGFLQNWLYFGVLFEAFGGYVDLSEFIADDTEGNCIVTTSTLDEACDNLVQRLEALTGIGSDNERRLHTAHLWNLFIHNWTLTTGTILRYDSSKIDERLWVSITVLAEALGSVLAYIDQDKDHANIPWYRLPGNPPVGQFLVEEMARKGWCPFDVKRIDCTSEAMSTLYCLANLPPPRTELDHTKCTEHICSWMSIGPSYKTKHMEKDCDCDRFEDVKQVISALQETEGIPLIQAKGGKNENNLRPFDIIPSKPDTDFIAISHVWAEGLGNPHSNALPSCSLNWVSDLVNKLPGAPNNKPVLFWVDTICVPLAPKEMHTRAMNRLRYPYENARHVLVLDSYLYMLWTFQEGRLAKSLYFQFSDRALTLEEIYYTKKSNLAGVTFASQIFIAYRGHNVLRDIDREFRPAPNIFDMREALKFRAVSFASDEGLCVFANLGLDMEIITRLPPDQRMPTLWRTVDQIPLGLVFSSASQKLTEPGLHWAPASFMGDLDTRHWDIELTPPKYGFPTPEGLQIQVPGYEMDQRLLLSDDSFDDIFHSRCPFQDENGMWYFVGLEKPWNQSRTKFPRHWEKLIILLLEPMSVRGENSVENPFATQPSMQGIIGIVACNADVFPFKAYRHITLTRVAHGVQQLYNSASELVEEYVKAKCTRSAEARTRRIAETGMFAAAESPERFVFTEESRTEMQALGEHFAVVNGNARTLSLAHGRELERSDDEVPVQYGHYARSMLQMRGRNQIKSFPATSWCID